MFSIIFPDKKTAMSILSTTLIALSMSTDAFAASLAKGAGIAKPRVIEAMQIGLVFGVIEFLMPLIGWLAGQIASGYVQEVDHWIAFILLGLIGNKMVMEGLKKEEFADDVFESAKLSGSVSGNPLKMVVTAFCTSIDSFTIGISLAFLSLDVWMTAICIGLATFSMTSFGIMAGHLLGVKFGKITEIIGGIVLITIGTSILLTHLGLI